MRGKGKKAIAGRIAVTVLLGLCVAGVIYGICMLAGAIRKERLIEARGPVTIVVFGDSIWAQYKDATGIASILEEELEQADVVDCSVMGSRISYKKMWEGATEDDHDWNRISLMGVLHEEDGLDYLMERSGLTEIPLEQADYFVVAYGLNDYFTEIPRHSEDPYDTYTYAGALRTAVTKLREINPTAKILLLSQTYCQGYAYGKVDSESDYKDYGGGTGPEYVATMELVAEEMDCIFVNNYKDMGINIHNGPKYLSDATHLTAYGRRKYAHNLVKYLLEDYERSVSQK